MMTYYHCTLICDPLGVDTHIVQGEGDTLSHVGRMLIQILQKLFHIQIATLSEQLAVVDVNHN